MTTTKDKPPPPPQVELPKYLAEQKKALVKEFKKFGRPVQSLEEALKIKPEAAVDQQTVDQILQKQEEVKSLIEKIDKSVSDDELIKNFEFSKENINKIIDRICLLRKEGNYIDADFLESSLIEKTNKKLKKSTIQRQISEKMKALSPERYNYPFEVLGYRGKQSRIILIWHNKKIYELSIKSIRNEDDLKLIFGKNFDLDQMKKHIIDEAHKKGELEDHKEIKSGVWKFGESWLIVSGGEFLHITQNEINFLTSPIYEKNIIQSDTTWIDLHKLKKMLETDCNQVEKLREVFYIIREYADQWTFIHKSMLDYVTAFVMLTLLQAGMTWRPWLYLRGSPGSGKSTFIETILEPIFGDIIKKLDKTTPHCIAQSVGNTTNICVLDEFEKNERNGEILQLCKLMNIGGTKSIGTLESKPKSFALLQMPWFASIFPPITINSDEAQRDRFIFFEIRKERKKPLIKTISPEEGTEIREKTIASLIANWRCIENQKDKILENSEKIIIERNNNINKRNINNFQYASVLLSMITEQEYTVPQWAEQEQITDGKHILNLIVDSIIIEQGKSYSVGELVNYYSEQDYELEGFANRDKAKRLLQKYGLTVSENTSRGSSGSRQSKGKDFYVLGVYSIEAQKKLLKRCEEYKDSCIDSALLQIEGSEKGQLRFGSTRRRCIKIPLSEVDR